jgi:polyisoprenoid-binding protein YceI
MERLTTDWICKRGLLSLALALTMACAMGQRYEVAKSNIRFFSDAMVEDIAADNKKAVGIFDSQTSEIVFSVPIIEFEFEKSLMKEHFNEKYMETEKFPKALFKGKVVGFDLSLAEAQKVTATGQLTIHGVTRDVEIPGQMTKQGDQIIIHATTIAKLADYNIAIPQMLFQNIAEQVEVTLDFTLKPRGK